MTWCVQYHPADQPHTTEHHATEHAANHRADWLVKGMRIRQVVVFEIADDVTDEGNAA